LLFAVTLDLGPFEVHDLRAVADVVRKLSQVGPQGRAVPLDSSDVRKMQRLVAKTIDCTVKDADPRTEVMV
jgi:hypothetical protein